MQWFKRLFGLPSAGSLSNHGSHSVRRVTLSDPLVIVAPRIAFLNLLGASAQSILEEDKLAFAPLFASCEESQIDTPQCDVLLIYAQLQSDGQIRAASESLRDIIHRSRAPIVVVATENDGKSYIAASKRPGAGRANLVMTLKRNGPAFTKFFSQLFSKMYKGSTMPMAWVELAPQVPRLEHPNAPDSIFAAEVSHIIFK